MLDSETRRRIDNCRDILVGKLPDPKAQIEQITIGLIYKFMDDMDKEAMELGGKAKFFSDYTVPDPNHPEDRSKDIPVLFSNYAWDKLMAPKMTAVEMLTLYSEAIVGMEKNPNVPQLFRDIFKNAYLPYRDPETLKMFLKTIGEFEYTHSEKLGDAFEYLLSVMGSQGDAGQFRTPRHIIDFLVAIVDPDKHDTILDPACGTAGFLISAYKHILLKHTKAVKTEHAPSRQFNIFSYNQLDEKPFNNLGDQLTPDDRKKLIQNLAGYDISPDMMRLSLVNLYLHGFPNPNIFEYDTLSSEDRWNESFDVVLANPPFMSPKGGIRPHKRFTISSNRSEVLFVDYIAEHLNPGGKAGIIVPEGIIFQSGKAYKALRKMLVEDYLYGVVSLPAGVFNPYSGVKTSILLLDKEIAKQRDEILFVKIDNDGYNLGAQRNPIKGGQLAAAIDLIHAYVKDGKVEASEMAHVVPKTEIAKGGDYNLSGERYRNLTVSNSSFELVPIEELFELIRNGKNVEQFDTEGKYRVTRIQTIADGTVDLNKTKWTNDEVTKDYFMQYGDILLSHINSFEHLAKSAIFDIKNEQVVHGVNLIRFRPDETKINPKYALSIFKSEVFLQTARSFAQRAVNQASLRISDLKAISIPLPPLSVQESIVSEIEGYQKIIDGAKAVVENYKPVIDIDPEWEMVELGEVCEINPKKSELKAVSGDTEVSFVPMADLNENQIDFVAEQTRRLEEVIKGYTYFKENDVLLAKVTPCFENGKAGIARNLKNNLGFGSSEFFVIRPNEKILSTWIYLQLITDNFRNRGRLNMTGTGGLQRVPTDYLKTTLIPLPSIKVQERIIFQVEKEQALVNANKELIEIFEQKIRDRIAKVWGAPAASDEVVLEELEGDSLGMVAEAGEGYCSFKRE